MVEQLVMVNGLPGSGKTTLSLALAAAMIVPVVSKDAIKESLADIAGRTVNSSALGELASDVMWQLLARMPQCAIVESWWFRPRDLDFVRRGLHVAGEPIFVEVWCEVPPKLAWERYRRRKRHPVHPDGDNAKGPWVEWSKDPQPVALGPVLAVETSEPVDVDRLALRIRSFLNC